MEECMARELPPSELEVFPTLGWSDVRSRLTPAVRSALERVLETENGASLGRGECFALANVSGDDLLGLLVAPDLLRPKLWGNLVAYVVNRNINFSNICFVGCTF